MSPPDPTSRYRDVPLVVVPDAQGRLLASRDLRLLPDVTGTFTHTVVQGDRLDRLATAYYRQPLVWWHICDANPDVLSPLALVGAEPVATLTFPVTISGVPDWADLLAALADAPGVEDVAVVDDVELVDQAQTVSGQQVTVTVEIPVRAVAVRRNEATARLAGFTAADLAKVITDAGFTVGPIVRSDAVGSAVAVPPVLTGGG
jgi:hypothetical protein